MSKTVNTKPVVRTSAGLRDALFDELDALKSGETNPAKANATAKLAGGIIDTVKMEMDVQKHVAKFSTKGTEKIAAIVAPVQLGAVGE